MGNTPVILAFNKFALVPRLDEGDLLYLQHAAQTKGVRCLSAHAISATQGRGIDALAEAILDVIGKRNLIVCGGASVGKSTLINQLAPRISDASARLEAPRTRFELQISADRKAGKMNGPTGGFSSSRALREASELRGTMMAFIALDSTLPGQSLLDLKSVAFDEDGKPVLSKYMDAFPFPNYVLLRDITQLPNTFGDLLRQWFAMVSN